jgi:hypothetical protein
MSPREIIQQIETNPALPNGQGDRFGGYVIGGLPFRSGHVLALRRFPASSIGPGYTSVWHRDPRGVWTFYSTLRPDLGCSRYFGGEVTRNVVVPIGIEWNGPAQFNVNIGTDLRWKVRLTASLPSHLMNAAARLVPHTWWQKRFALKAMGAAARFALGAGKMKLAGKTPNGQEFIANPKRVWLIGSSHAVLKGMDLGPAGALAQQARLNDVFIPQRGIFAVVEVFMQTPRQTSGMLPVPDRLNVDEIKELS